MKLSVSQKNALFKESNIELQLNLSVSSYILGKHCRSASLLIR